MDFLSFYFAIEFILMLLLINKYKEPNPFVLSYLIFLFYSQANYLDYVFTGNNNFFTNYSLIKLDILSDSYFLASSCYFLFLLTFGLIGLFKNLKIATTYNKKNEYNKLVPKIKIIIILCLLYTLLYHIISIDFDRLTKKSFSLIKYDFFIFYLLFYIWGFEFLYGKTKSLLFYLMTIAVLAHALLSFEREFIVLIGLFLIFKKKEFFRGFKLISAVVFGFFILSVWKQFYINVIILSISPLEFFKNLSTNLTFSSGETTVGLSLLSNYFQNDIYGDYYFSYVFNTISQFFRIFFDTDYVSLAEFTSIYYTNFEMGTAFSMILESILNFGYLGPLILPFIIIFLFKYFLKINESHYVDLFSVFFVFLMLKFVRTELTVLLKLYLLPFLLFLVIKKLTNKRKF